MPQYRTKHRVRAFLCKPSENYLDGSLDSTWGYFCTQASSLTNQAKGQADNIIERLPSSLRHYSLLPLYHAIVVIIDRLDSFDKDCKTESDGFISLRKLAQLQTVLIARTGAEKGLSAPISFESLRSQSLPLERSDVITQDVDVVRVSLAGAVQFIVSLEMREELAILHLKDELPLDTSLCPSAPRGFEENGQVRYSPEAWANALMVAAEKHGYDNIPETWESIHRVQAGLIGEGFCEFKHLPFGFRWR